jgi:bifunctional non-homologous end joining protein LigD
MICDGGLPSAQYTKSPSGDKWIHEIKVDGYRWPLHVWHGTVLAYTGRGYDWANRFKNIVEAVKSAAGAES